MTATQATGNQSSAVRVAITMGDDVSTDAIYPGRFMATVLPAETPQYAFADDSEFRGLLKGGSMPSGSALVAGTNFGCGSSREQAASALRGHNLVIIARGFARIFLQNAINLGLQVLVCPGIEASAGNLLEITAEGIHDRTTGRRYDIQPLPAARQAIMKAGGLIAFTRQRLQQR